MERLSLDEVLATGPDPRSRKGTPPLARGSPVSYRRRRPDRRQKAAGPCPVRPGSGRGLRPRPRLQPGPDAAPARPPHAVPAARDRRRGGGRGRWSRGRVPHHGGDAITLDGPTARRAAAGAVPGVQLLTAYVPAAAAVLQQGRGAAKTNAPQAALKWLGVRPLNGKGVTGDARFPHREGAEE